MKFQFFFGIDVSKLTLDFALFKSDNLLLHEKIKNNPSEITAWLKKIMSVYKIRKSNTVFCLEASGSYSENLISLLSKSKYLLWVESPLRIKKSMGMKRGKSDKIDSIRIGQYAFTNQKSFIAYKVPRMELKRLKVLLVLRNRLNRTLLTVTVPMKELQFSTKIKKEIESYCATTISNLKATIRQIETQMISIIENDHRLKRLHQIMTSINGVGNMLSICFLIYTNEFLNFTSPNKFACFCGVAPFEYSSGTSLNFTKVSKMSNRQMKKALHMPAVSAISHKGEIRDYYKRKVAEGHAKMSVLNAVKNKIIHRIFACVREDRLYQKKLTLTFA